MAVPQRRTSKTAKRLRRGHFKLAPVSLVACPRCGALVRPHHVCGACGYYKGKDILRLKKDED